MIQAFQRRFPQRIDRSLIISAPADVPGRQDTVKCKIPNIGNISMG